MTEQQKHWTIVHLTDDDVHYFNEVTRETKTHSELFTLFLEQNEV